MSRLDKKVKTINPRNKEDQCFQYAVTVALSYGEIESHPERVSNVKPFVNKYNWRGINYPSRIDDWKAFEKNDLKISLNILYVKEKKICTAYISKLNANCKKQTNKEK